MTTNDEIQPDIVGFWMRFLAYIVDALILFAISTALGMAFGMQTVFSIDWSDPSQLAGLEQQSPLLPTLLTIAYFPGFWIWKQATPGKMVIGAKIAAQDDLGVPGPVLLLRRSLLFILPNAVAFLSHGLTTVFGIVFVVSCIWIAIDENRQALHDKIGRTFVIKI